MKLAKLLSSVLVLASFNVFAHGEHPKPVAKCASACTKNEIEQAVPGALGSLALAGKIDQSWVNAKVENVELKQFKKGKDWVVTVFDSKKTTQQRLYVFITTDGFLNGTNYTGN